MLSTLLLLISTTFAGDLADSNIFHTLPFGPVITLGYISPMKGCIKNSYIYDPSILWYCSTTFAGYPVTAKYIVDENIFYAILLETNGYTTCEALKKVLFDSWGYTQKITDEPYIEKYFWDHLEVLSIYKSTILSNQCSIALINKDSFKEIQKKKS